MNSGIYVNPLIGVSPPNLIDGVAQDHLEYPGMQYHPTRLCHGFRSVYYKEMRAYFT